MPEDPPINNGAQEQMPARQDVDVLLDVSELEVDRIKLTVRDGVNPIFRTAPIVNF